MSFRDCEICVTIHSRLVKPEHPSSGLKLPTPVSCLVGMWKLYSTLHSTTVYQVGCSFMFGRDDAIYVRALMCNTCSRFRLTVSNGFRCNACFWVSRRTSSRSSFGGTPSRRRVEISSWPTRVRRWWRRSRNSSTPPDCRPLATRALELLTSFLVAKKVSPGLGENLDC